MHRARIAARDKSAHQIFGSPDDIKFMSSMTLFDVVVGGGLFSRALERFFDGERDKATLEILKQWERDA